MYPEDYDQVPQPQPEEEKEGLVSKGRRAKQNYKQGKEKYDEFKKIREGQRAAKAMKTGGQAAKAAKTAKTAATAAKAATVAAAPETLGLSLIATAAISLAQKLKEKGILGTAKDLGKYLVYIFGIIFAFIFANFIMLFVGFVLFFTLAFTDISGADEGGGGGGTPPPPGPVSGNYALPTDIRWYNEDSKPRVHHNYAALDIPTPTGSNIYAVTSGEITAINESCTEADGLSCGGGAGNSVRLLGDDGLLYWYMHLEYQSVIVDVRQKVQPGDPLAKTDNTGHSSGPHLHFEINCGVESKVPGGCTPPGHGGRRLFPHAEECFFAADATGPWKFIEAIRDNVPIDNTNAPWAKYGGCPNPPGDGA